MRYLMRFITATMTWAVLLVTLSVANQLIAGLGAGTSWGVAELAHQVPAWLGLLLPFAAFAGGLAVTMDVPAWRTGTYALPVLALAYLLTAFVAPFAEFRVDEAQGVEVAQDSRIGPDTPSAIRELRASARANPPPEFKFSTDDLSLLPPNWLTYLIHSKIVMALFAIFAGLLGQQVAFLTGGLSPPARRNARWALGLLTAILFFVAQFVGGEWIRSDPAHSGVVGSWICLIVPLVELGVLYRMAQRRGALLHALDASSVK
jgi:hypothetical protein